MDVAEFREFLRARVEATGGIVKFADVNEISATVVSEVLRGVRDPQPRVLAAVGFRLVKTYVPIDEESP